MSVIRFHLEICLSLPPFSIDTVPFSETTPIHTKIQHTSVSTNSVWFFFSIFIYIPFGSSKDESCQCQSIATHCRGIHIYIYSYRFCHSPYYGIEYGSQILNFYFPLIYINRTFGMTRKSFCLLIFMHDRNRCTSQAHAHTQIDISYLQIYNLFQVFKCVNSA